MVVPLRYTADTTITLYVNRSNLTGKDKKRKIKKIIVIESPNEHSQHCNNNLKDWRLAEGHCQTNTLAVDIDETLIHILLKRQLSSV